jgi:hypothetical protein
VVFGQTVITSAHHEFFERIPFHRGGGVDVR